MQRIARGFAVEHDRSDAVRDKACAIRGGRNYPFEFTAQVVQSSVPLTTLVDFRAANGVPRESCTPIAAFCPMYETAQAESIEFATARPSDPRTSVRADARGQRGQSFMDLQSAP